MKILVCISHVPDTTSKINFTNGDSEFDTNGVQYVINQMTNSVLQYGFKKNKNNSNCCKCWRTRN
jgi:hypothetical protein